MTEPTPPLEQALSRVEPRWDEARSQRTLPGARRKLAAAGRRRALGAAALVLAVLGGGAAWLTLPASEQPVAAAGYVIAKDALRFQDGSRARLLDDAASVGVSKVSPTAIEVQLLRGRARFDVSKRPERTFRVDCGEVSVEVLGTSFELLRTGARTHVRVVEGRVAVRWATGVAQLGAGEQGSFPPSKWEASKSEASGEASAQATPEAAGAKRQAEATQRAAAEPAASASRSKPASSWRQHAEQGDFSRAYALLEEKGTRVADDVEELLLAADAARLSGHPEQAVPFLQKVVQRHSADPRAPLASFTLGGVLMNQLGRPREAELAYGHARTLAPRSSLSQDALARQVEAAHRAGDQDRARELAIEYEARHPDGRRRGAVRRFGGLQ